MDGTTVNHNDGSPSYPPANNNGKSASPTRGNNEEDLHRYVTDDAPRAERQAAKPGNGLIVSVSAIRILVSADAYRSCNP